LRKQLANICILFACAVSAQQSFDSSGIKLPKHYFNTVIAIDYYQKPKVRLEPSTRVSRRLGTYGLNEIAVNLYTPLFTKVKTLESGTIRNFHFLLTVNYHSLRTQFSQITDHNLIKAGIGIRFIYNTGKKAVWFVDAAPFVTRDLTYASDVYRRFASTIVLSVNESARFNWRIGITKSFMWGNRYYLPYLGVRFGRLDKVNLSIQIPRNIALNIPVSENFILSVFTRPQGGMYLFSNTDSIYLKQTENAFHFTRYEIITGLRADVRIKRVISLYASAGISSKNNLTFYSDNSNAKLSGSPYNIYFYEGETRPTLFINAGVVVRLGKARSSHNDKNILDAIDLNNDKGPAIQISPEARQQSKLNMKSVEDLIDYNDY
jgi:hypothetical protein